jgi:predicted phage terminase large subunit-like protein
VQIKLQQDPGQAGKAQAQRLVRLLAGYRVTVEPVTGSKASRAWGLASQIESYGVTFVKAGWNREVLEELRVFPVGAKDDIPDAMSDGFNHLTGSRRLIVY